MFGRKTCVLLSLLFCFPKWVEAEEITIYTYQHLPYAEQTDTTHKGMIIEIIDELFSRADIDYKIIFNPLKRGLTMTSRSQGVCVLPIDRTQQRESEFRWVGPILISRYGLFSAKDKSLPLITLQDAKSYSIGTFLGSGIGEYLTSFEYQVQLTNDDNLNIKKLQRDRIQLWASEIISAKTIMDQSKVQLGEPELIFYTALRAMACNRELEESKHDALVEALNSMYQDGFMVRINEAYGASL
ncbi:substrate-binding periplasmic protein [Shewanella japonica]|uniref:substrate-binding periplasmic protein n=1 Tax=Shewanella japonica TaxID=93973 RepID=UPI002493D587|nr:transporter substrate-binding domain-containing protein [Shewanella japonica]